LDYQYPNVPLAGEQRIEEEKCDSVENFAGTTNFSGYWQ